MIMLHNFSKQTAHYVPTEGQEFKKKVFNCNTCTCTLSRCAHIIENQNISTYEPRCEKNGLRVFDLVPHKPDCAATEDG